MVLRIGKRTGAYGESDNIVNVTIQGRAGDKVTREYKKFGSNNRILERDIKIELMNGGIKSIDVNSIKRVPGSASFTLLKRPGEG